MIYTMMTMIKIVLKLAIVKLLRHKISQIPYIDEGFKNLFRPLAICMDSLWWTI
jgi:hypothetical protein